ncbi:MBL fold metallo-hydrolase [Spongisporangium articulatum]|uniref:MBL fold metallo-hydrolase n=1 Tax=Spongisporangium articulatum TaxID=3362603 RepID=A0ABW8AIK3_9ACTN
MKLALLGVRGSTPAPGPAFLRYGGHTSCVAVLDSADRPVVVLDAGTGVRELPRLLHGSAYRGPLVLSHLHWDHLHGLPFCPALDSPEAEVELWVPPAEDGVSARELLSRVMSPPFFPIGPSGLLGRWTFRTAGTGRLDGAFGAARVELAPVRHKGGRTWAVRVDLDGTSVAYVPDHTLVSFEDGALVDRSGDDVEAIELIHGVDVLLHDGQFVGSEGRLAAEYGHSTIEDVVRWADRCAVGSLVLTHHAPTRADDALDALAEKFTATPEGRPVTFARQGTLLSC